MGGYRAPYEIPKQLLPASGRRLIQAFFLEEGDQAIPMDQVLVEAGAKPPPNLMLPKGKFRFTYQEIIDHQKK